MISVAATCRPQKVRACVVRVPPVAMLAAFAACANVEGCALFDRSTPPQHLARIPGIESLTFDGVDVVATTGAPDDSTWLAVFSQTGPATVLRLRAGDAFLVTDRASMSALYELIRAGEDELLFRVERRTLSDNEPGGVRKTTSIIAVAPYEAPKTTSETAPAPSAATPRTPG